MFKKQPWMTDEKIKNWINNDPALKKIYESADLSTEEKIYYSCLEIQSKIIEKITML